MTLEKELIFQIGKHDEIKLYLPSDVHKIYRYDEIKIILQTDDGNFILYNNDFIIEAITAFVTLINKASKHLLELHSSIVGKEIGLLSNDNYHGEHNNLVFEDNFWVGDRHRLWETNLYTTWLYNKDGKVFFEVTPIYDGHFDNTKSNEKYQKFKDNYETIYLTEVDKKYIKQWQNSCDKIIQVIKRNK